MKIGNIPDRGTSVQEGKWYWGVEILRVPPWLHGDGLWKPYLNVVCVKWDDRGEPFKVKGRAEKKIGGWKQFACPYSLTFRIGK